MRPLALLPLLALAFSPLAAEPVTLGPKGINLGNFLEAPHEGAWTDGRQILEEDFSIIARAGFTLIRVPVGWTIRMGPAPDYTIDPKFFEHVDWVVAQAKKNNLQVILDNHVDSEIRKDPDKWEPRMLTIWKQIAEHYKNEPPSVIFELLNEPSEKLTAPVWNKVLADTLKVVRESNPTRSVIVGPIKWNNIGELPGLVLPEDDRNLIVTVHYYDPMKFTHQGASWQEGSKAWMGTKWLGNKQERGIISRDFNKAGAWARVHKRPIFLGEYGALETGDMDSRARWTAWVTHCAKVNGMGFTYWEYCSGFGAYDPVAKKWRQPLLDALLGKGAPIDD